ncbi:hypothetical protein LCGC14_0414460 [marine sediment metagenome]|uniref:Uncharacterized protein n=1 Tax=marine sediment metagenome TaxID=412755 RepID=A0A0F9VEQ5_9ZZZZ
MGDLDRPNRVIRNAEHGYYKRNWKVSPSAGTHRHPLYGTIQKIQSLNVNGRWEYRAISKSLRDVGIREGWLLKKWSKLETAKYGLWCIWKQASKLTDRYVLITGGRVTTLETMGPDVVVRIPVIDKYYADEIWDYLLDAISSIAHVKMVGQRVLEDPELQEAVIVAGRLRMREEIEALAGSVLSELEVRDAFVASGSWLG